MITTIKAKSSWWLNRTFTDRPFPFHWQEGYCIFSVSPETLDKVKHYILQQDEHHRSMTYNDEFMRYYDKLISLQANEMKEMNWNRTEVLPKSENPNGLCAFRHPVRWLKPPPYLLKTRGLWETAWLSN